MKFNWPTVVLVCVFVAASACVLIFAPPDVQTWALEALAVSGTIGAALFRPILEKAK